MQDSVKEEEISLGKKLDGQIREAWKNLPVDVRDRLVNSYAVHDCEGIAQTAYRQGFEDGYRYGKEKGHPKD